MITESVRRVLNETLLYTKDIDTSDLRINAQWFDENLRDKIIAWVEKYAEDFEDWHNKTYGDEY